MRGYKHNNGEWAMLAVFAVCGLTLSALAVINYLYQ
jgi:hypothetical protein